MIEGDETGDALQQDVVSVCVLWRRGVTGWSESDLIEKPRTQ
jgi:hypothetical protein